jgi:hypothetical protein
MEYQLRNIDPEFWRRVKRFVLNYDKFTIRDLIFNAIAEYLDKYEK